MDYIEKITQELLAYPYEVTKRPDFDAFWEKNLKSIEGKPLEEERKKIDFPSPYIDVYDISYLGADETRIHGWLLIPSFLKRETYPCLLHYHGFCGSRGEPIEFLSWAMTGCCVLSVDCRSQGGITGDAHYYDSGLITNVTSQGILDKDDYYFKHLYLDAVRALDYVCSLPEVEKQKIVVEGGSQGGALSLAAACLDDRPKAVMCDVPSSCQIDKRIEGEYGSFAVAADYLRRYPKDADKVFETVSYFDIVNMADKISCPVFASVGAKDDVCPARFFMGAYQRMNVPKQVQVYPFFKHAVSSEHQEKKMAYLRRIAEE